jgi:serine/threonine protein kinase
LSFLRQLVDGLQHVHQNGIIHRYLNHVYTTHSLRYTFISVILHNRDLKPNNVFMTRDGCLKIGDFGLSKLLAEALTEDASDVGSLPAVHHPSVHTQGVGTISYASPEQVSGTEYDHKVDSFRYVSIFSKAVLQICTSLGVIVLELFCIFKTEMERAEALKDLRSTECHLPESLVQAYPDIAHLIRHLVAPTAQRWSMDTTQKYLKKTFPQVQLEKAQEVSELRQQLQENHIRLKEQDAIIEELRRQVAALSNE